MTNQLEKLSARKWADQFDMSEEEYSDQVAHVKRACQDEYNLRMWADIVNRFQITSAKQWDKQISRILAKAQAMGVSEEFIISLIRLKVKHAPRELQL